METKLSSTKSGKVHITSSFRNLPEEVLLNLYKEKIAALEEMSGLASAGVCSPESNAAPLIGEPAIDRAPLWVRVALLDEMLSCPLCRREFSGT